MVLNKVACSFLEVGFLVFSRSYRDKFSREFITYPMVKHQREGISLLNSLENFIMNRYLSKDGAVLSNR